MTNTYGLSALSSPMEALRHLLTNTHNIIAKPGEAFSNLAVKTSGAHPLPISQTMFPYWLTDRQQPIRQIPQPLAFATLAQNGHPGTLPTIPQRPRPALNLIPGSYNDLQPFGDVSQEELSPQQSLQPTGYNNQTSLNGQFTQGPLSSFYRLMGQ